MELWRYWEQMFGTKENAQSYKSEKKKQKEAGLHLTKLSI